MLLLKRFLIEGVFVEVCYKANSRLFFVEDGVVPIDEGVSKDPQVLAGFCSLGDEVWIKLDQGQK